MISFSRPLLKYIIWILLSIQLLCGKIDPMREIVDRILQEERSASSRLELAQTQSQNIILKSKEEAAALIKEAIDKAEALANKNKEESEKNFLAERERILREAKAAAAISRSRREKEIPRISGEIFSKIITIKG